ncbi:unnamed protein product [Adineta steineri]|uniref:Uncharacterized protein n=1 Tax=Adineta steineri TaxID=433720 RepID=A0A813SMT2_9BILA|nr:unnamed protein product [Adineta steineri]CAF3759742.1 unnamed protein product [Adineta steineri]
MIFFYPCDRIYDATKTLCGNACFWDSISNSLAQYMLIAHDIIPIVIIVVFSAALLFRTVMQKRRLQQGNGWRQYRKMIIQFILISITYLTFNLPYTIFYFGEALGFSTFSIDVTYTYVFPPANVPSMVLPYATLITLPGLKEKLFALIICKVKQNTIRPLVA